MTVEAVFQDRDTFATMVRQVAMHDLARMGIEILSFTIKDVYDNVEYLDSLGKTQTAMVKRDADIGVAEANRDAGIKARAHSAVARIMLSSTTCRRPMRTRPLWTLSTQQIPKSPTPSAACSCNRPRLIRK